MSFRFKKISKTGFNFWNTFFKNAIFSIIKFGNNLDFWNWFDHISLNNKIYKEIKILLIIINEKLLIIVKKIKLTKLSQSI